MYFYIFSAPPPSYTPITLIALSEQMFTTDALAQEQQKVLSETRETSSYGLYCCVIVHLLCINSCLNQSYVILYESYISSKIVCGLG